MQQVLKKCSWSIGLTSQCVLRPLCSCSIFPSGTFPFHGSLGTYVGPGAQPGVEKWPGLARQPFTAQLGEPDKLPDRLQCVWREVLAACARLPWERRGGPVNTQMRAAPDICARLSASQRHGCERWGRARKSKNQRPQSLSAQVPSRKVQ